MVERFSASSTRTEEKLREIRRHHVQMIIYAALLSKRQTAGKIVLYLQAVTLHLGQRVILTMPAAPRIIIMILLGLYLMVHFAVHFLCVT